MDHIEKSTGMMHPGAIASCIPSLFEALRALPVPAAAEDGHSQGQSGYCHRDVQDLHHATGTVPDIKISEKT